MFYRWRTKLKRDRFYRLTKGVLATPPMPIVDAPWTIVSMVGNDDVQMYILALKSFYRLVKAGRVAALIADDMPQQDRRLMERHFPSIELVMRQRLPTGKCQQGGCWERLIYLIDQSETRYGIQLDSDTLALGPDIDEVMHCIRNNISFALGSMQHRIEPMASVAREAQGIDSDYIGIVTERLFDRYPGAENLKYVRASAAFTGFAHGGFSRERIEAFHEAMERLLGPRWREWGTEQCASNFAIANSPEATVLLRPKYSNFGPDHPRSGSAFLHFLGTWRYDDDYFAKCAQTVIAELNKGA